jgi:hypothetical protein
MDELEAVAEFQTSLINLLQSVSGYEAPDMSQQVRTEENTEAGI